MGDFRLGSVLGFEIRIDYSWFVIFFLILWSFSFSVFPAEVPERSTATYLAMGGVGTLLFFASLLAHELSHSVVARAKGIPVEGITLFIFGGMARTRLEAEEPGDEFVIAGMGPVASLFIAGLFLAAWWVGGRLGAPPTVTAVARYLAVINVALAVFNLLPGFPLDGGRLFRSLVWRWTGDLTRATRMATTGGKWLGYGLMGLGAAQMLAGGVVGGLWLVFIGWFLRTAAISSFRQHVLRNLLAGVRVRDLMTPDPETVPPDLGVEELVHGRLLRRRYQSFPVQEGGRALGLVTLDDVKAVDREAWPRRTVRDVMRPAGEAVVVGPDDPMSDAMDRLGEAGERRALVVEGDRLAGIITSTDVSRWIQRGQDLGDLVGRQAAEASGKARSALSRGDPGPARGAGTWRS